jgi:hypothetical protein
MKELPSATGFEFCAGHAVTKIIGEIVEENIALEDKFLSVWIKSLIDSK